MAEFKVGEPVKVAGESVPVVRILGRNAGPMTGPGTNTYLVGDKELVLIDPGPADDRHIDSLIKVIDDRQLNAVLVTHTHGDHSPAATPIARQLSAQLVGIQAPESGRHDRDFIPDRVFDNGELLEFGEYTIELIHTPGHVSNHFCYLLQEEKLLFTGDHILQGTTSVILPPDGDMQDYMESLRQLRERDLLYLAPGHGDLIPNPQSAINALIDHRQARENKIVSALDTLGESDIDQLVVTVYDDVAEHLIPWAKLTLEAHLIKLKAESRVILTDRFWQLV